MVTLRQAVTAAVQRAHPDLFIGEVGTASTNKAVAALINHDFHQAEATSVPVTLLILAAFLCERSPGPPEPGAKRCDSLPETSV